MVPADDVSSADINTVVAPLRARGADIHPLSIFFPVRLVVVNEVPLHHSGCEGHREIAVKIPGAFNVAQLGNKCY